MVTKIDDRNVKETEEERIAPWWERSSTYCNMWKGDFFDQMILKGDDEDEQRVQRIREILKTRGSSINI